MENFISPIASEAYSVNSSIVFGAISNKGKIPEIENIASKNKAN
tara:strand:+ start:624 stop:755 length:132 start_codon:yes stop_codon:yes gene_type:complete